MFDSWYFRGERFESVEELSDIAMRLSGAVKVPLKFMDFTTPPNIREEMLDRWMGVMNYDTKEIAAIVSDNYEIIQHQDAVLDLANSLADAGESVKGAVMDHGNSITVRYMFDELDTIDDGSEGICVGGEMKNSYDKTSSFRGGAFLVRLVCSNGMVTKSVIPDINFSIYHTRNSKDRSQKQIKGYIEHMIDEVYDRLGLVIETAVETEVSFEDSDKLSDALGAVIGVKSHADAIVDNFWNGELDTNRWDLYNAATEYVSHTELTPQTRDRLSSKVEDLLMPKVELVA